MLNAPLTLKDLSLAATQMANSKSPGADGLPQTYGEVMNRHTP